MALPTSSKVSAGAAVAGADPVLAATGLGARRKIGVVARLEQVRLTMQPAAVPVRVTVGVAGDLRVLATRQVTRVVVGCRTRRAGDRALKELRSHFGPGGRTLLVLRTRVFHRARAAGCQRTRNGRSMLDGVRASAIRMGRVPSPAWAVWKIAQRGPVTDDRNRTSGDRTDGSRPAGVGLSVGGVGVGVSRRGAGAGVQALVWDPDGLAYSTGPAVCCATRSNLD